MGNSIKDFFAAGGVFLFDEENSASENTYYKVEDFMGEIDGENITQTEVDEEGLFSIFYDCTVLTDEQALVKYNNNEYVHEL